jgi:hypothetical protein
MSDVQSCTVRRFGSFPPGRQPDVIGWKHRLRLHAMRAVCRIHCSPRGRKITGLSACAFSTLPTTNEPRRVRTNRTPRIRKSFCHRTVTGGASDCHFRVCRAGAECRAVQARRTRDRVAVEPEIRTGSKRQLHASRRERAGEQNICIAHIRPVSTGPVRTPLSVILRTNKMRAAIARSVQLWSRVRRRRRLQAPPSFDALRRPAGNNVSSYRQHAAAAAAVADLVLLEWLSMPIGGKRGRRENEG